MHTYKLVVKQVWRKSHRRQLMKIRLRAHIEYLDEFLYWIFVALVAIGVITNQFLPPKMDAVALSGIFFACLLLKPMIFLRGC